MKIGFISAINDIDINLYQPLSFGYLKSYLETHLSGQVEMSYIDSYEDIEKCDVIGVSCLSQDFSHAKNIGKYIRGRNKDVVLILGGNHITFLPETLPNEFDIGVIGEGELTFTEIISCIIKNGKHPSWNQLKEIRGIVFYHNGHLIFTEKRVQISFLDALPYSYRSKDKPPYLFTSRGCLYKCTFCSSSEFWGKARFFSAEYVVHEIELIIQQFPNIKGISIWDDLFTYDKTRFKEIVDLICDKRINKKVSFVIPVRGDLITHDLCEDLNRMNVIGINFGAESGSNKILNFLNKHTTVERNQIAIDIAYEHNLKVGCSFIVGCPTETEEDVRKTYRFILRNMIDGKLSTSPSINILMPMPGTKMWDYAISKGLILSPIEWDHLSIFASYRDSSIREFSDWANCRLENRSIYMAEETLPEKRLLELMYKYDSVIKSIEGIC